MPDRQSGPIRLPIKLILPKQGIERKVPGGGGAKEPFQPVNANFRNRLSNQVSAIRSAILPQISKTGAAPVRVKLLQRALAKSHRPEELFSSDSCPIIGAGRLGELFVKATPAGLDRLSETIELNQTIQIKKELSCVESIDPITPLFRRKGVDAKDILRRSPRGKHGFITRVKLFNYGTDDDQSSLVRDFEVHCRHRRISISQGGYSASSYTYRTECNSIDDINALSRIIGVRSITQMPHIRSIRPRMINLKPLPNLTSRDSVSGDIPVVVVVDTGISDHVPELDKWVFGRESRVAPQYQNSDHGTFVAGLIVWGNELNPTIPGLDDAVCGVFDLQVIPNHDPAHGDTDTLLESELLQSLDTALKQYSNEYKVWNLSLGTDTICSLDEFSPLAEELDNLQEKYRVSFVISAGNYETPPLLDYPRTNTQLETGRITSPADSVLGITVGALSHVDYKKNGPKQNHPAGFSRHGAGPNHIIKPDLVNYGGSCSRDLSHIAGIRSINGSGTAENLGTSFATPLVSRNLAQIFHRITPSPSPVLARALLTHHARDPRTQARVPDAPSEPTTVTSVTAVNAENDGA